MFTLKRLISRRLEALCYCLTTYNKDIRSKMGIPVIAGMATMPDRFNTFKQAFESIINQVDKFYLYLDGYKEIPEIINNNKKVIPILSDDVPGLHANGKFLGLIMEEGEYFYLSLDDDLLFPINFVDKISSGLAMYGYKAVVGYHGSMLSIPFISYNTDREVIAYDSSLWFSIKIDVLGTGAVMFFSKYLKFDVRVWTFTNMVDLGMAIEAAKSYIPLICLPRKKRFIQMLERRQKDSIFEKLCQDDTQQTELARKLLDLKMTY